MDRSARTTPDPRFERDRPAVEVIATFDGAIVDARHFDDPTCGVIRRSTTLQLAGGGVALVLSLLLFVVAYTRGGGTALDITTALLMAGGLTALTRGLLAHHDDRRPRDYTVGTGAGALLPLSAGAIREPLFPLLRSTGAGYELTITSGMVGDVTTEGRTLPLHEAIRAADESPGQMCIAEPSCAAARLSATSFDDGSSCEARSMRPSLMRAQEMIENCES